MGLTAKGQAEEGSASHNANDWPTISQDTMVTDLTTRVTIRGSVTTREGQALSASGSFIGLSVRSVTTGTVTTQMAFLRFVKEGQIIPFSQPSVTRPSMSHD